MGWWNQLILQPFGGFLCSDCCPEKRQTSEGEEEGGISWEGGEEGETKIGYNVHHVAAIAMIILLHFCYIVQRSRSSPDGDSEAYALSPGKTWHWIALVASVVVLILHTLLCGRASSSDFSHDVVSRVHVVRIQRLPIQLDRNTSRLLSSFPDACGHRFVSSNGN